MIKWVIVLRLSNSQFFWLLATIEVSMTIWLTIMPTITQAGQDAWIAIFIGGLIGIAATFLYYRISCMYPGLTLIAINNRIFGKGLGKLVSLCYLLGWFSVTVVILRTMAEFIQLVLFFHTSILIISLIMVLIIMYIVYYGGITAIARFSQIVGPVFFLVLLITFLLNLTNIKLALIAPVYVDHGFATIAKASVIHGSFLSESVLIMMILPFLHKPQKAGGSALSAVAVSSLIVVIATALVIMTFGPVLSGKFINPYFNMVRFISALDFIQNMDVWVIFVWLFCVFVKLSLYLSITSQGIAEWLHLKDAKKVIIVLGVLYLGISLLPPNITYILTNYNEKIWLIYIFGLNMILLPIIMFMIALFKTRKYKGG